MVEAVGGFVGVIGGHWFVPLAGGWLLMVGVGLVFVGSPVPVVAFFYVVFFLCVD